MKLSKPALMSAFLCPGVGQWVTGHRLLGGLLVFAAVTAPLTPILIFLYSIVAAPSCDPFEHGILGCAWKSLAFAWSVANGPLGIGALVFAFVWIVAVVHANRLELPGHP